jgi:hypothetical protein
VKTIGSFAMVFSESPAFDRERPKVVIDRSEKVFGTEKVIGKPRKLRRDSIEVSSGSDQVVLCSGKTFPEPREL